MERDSRECKRMIILLETTMCMYQFHINIWTLGKLLYVLECICLRTLGNNGNVYDTRYF